MGLIKLVRTWLRLKGQRDPAEVARVLGRPERLELSQEQAEAVEKCFLEAESPAMVAKCFFRMFPRTEFRFFMVPSPDGKALEFGNADPVQDGIELIQAAMIKLGAMIEKEDGWYYELAHPMTKRLAYFGSQPVEPPKRTGGLVGAL